MKWRVRLTAIASGAALLAGCPGPPAKLSEVQREVFQKSCIFSACHQAAGAAGGLTLDGSPYASLVNQPSVGSPGRTRVVPRDLQASYLYEKLGNPTPAVGTQMPPGAPLSADQLQLVRSWILDGAKDD